jgi:signal transduction histidine kinase/ActR/RegA family two-component response regulator
MALSPSPSRAALDLVHGYLSRPALEQPPLDHLLAELATAFAACGAGLASLPDGATSARHPAEATAPPCLDVARAARGTVTLERAGGGSFLLAPVADPAQGPAWALWLEDDRRAAWPDDEAAALHLAGLSLSRWLQGADRPRWADQLDLLARQQRLETAADVTRRIAHDFGNVLTGILGFIELALAQQVPANTALHSHLTEVYRSAQAGAQFTHQLRLFSRRQSTTSRSCLLAGVLAEEEARVRGLDRDGQWALSVSVPTDLPPVALDADHLRQVLAALLDNAREALAGPGSITVSARAAELSAADCLGLFGAVRPGPHVEVCIADTGSGLSPEAQRRLFAEPFFTTKPRRRGFGLAIAYGILHAHRGGLRLYPGAEHGALARVVLPAAPRSALVPHAGTAAALGQGNGSEREVGEKVLVVDDDPQVLRYVASTLQQAGYRVQAVSNAEDAWQSYLAQNADPFRLVLSDVVMPRTTGIDLARRLLANDGLVRVLFMSGRVAPDFTRQGLAPNRIDLLTKPFAPDGLLRAVRSALDRLEGGRRGDLAPRPR